MDTKKEVTIPRVLHLHFGKDGGAERFFVNLVNALGERGVEQRFIIRPRRSWRREIEALGPIIENHYRYISFSSLLLPWRVRRMLRQWQPDAIMAWMTRAARLIPDWPGAVKLARIGNFPPHLRHFSRCDALVGNMPGIRSHCKDLGWTRPVHTISNFPREVSPVPVARAALGTPDDVFLISGAGRFLPRKGHDLLIRVTAQIPDAWLWLIGDGQERRTLEKLAHKVGIADRTRFVGWVEEPIHYVAATDVFGMPSRYEPLGNVILEAWQAGVPVVATRSEGPSWYMTDSENGLLVDIDDLDAFVAAVRRLHNDYGLAETLVAGGRKQLEETFNKNRIVDQYLDLFAGNLNGDEV
ncbi:MAG: glycosyltransferase [Nitrospira sp.]|nr:glycosyltransferase [Nitrospira sp.]MDE0405208.1 glycosyltransferase [Nitrospira sp.]MDE0485834.1 glycosyltransferase [Nitrospira sp.]